MLYIIASRLYMPHLHVSLTDLPIVVFFILAVVLDDLPSGCVSRCCEPRALLQKQEAESAAVEGAGESRS